MIRTSRSTTFLHIISVVLSWMPFDDQSVTVANGEIGSQSDHDRACSGPLTASELRRGANALAQRSGERYDNEVSGCVHHDGDGSQRHELKENVAVRAVHKLRNE